MKIDELNILSNEYIVKYGIYFDGDIICWSGKYGNQVYKQPIEKGGTPFTGLLYENYPNGVLAYYSFYENGFGQGINIEFYSSGNVKKYCILNKGIIVGKAYEWYENGKIKEETDHYQNNNHYKFIKWDEKGNIIKQGEI